MKTVYEIKTMTCEYLDVLADDWDALMEQGADARARKTGNRPGPWAFFEDTYPGLATNDHPDSDDFMRITGDRNALRTLKYDLEYNLKPYTPKEAAGPAPGAMTPAGLLHAQQQALQQALYPSAQPPQNAAAPAASAGYQGYRLNNPFGGLTPFIVWDDL